MFACGTNDAVPPRDAVRPDAKPTADMKAVLGKLDALRPMPIELLTPEQARKQPTIADAVRALRRDRGESTDPQPVARVEDRKIPGAAGEITARIYTPEGASPFPVVLYFHGGGWVLGTIDTYDASARAIANAARTIVVSVECRKAPESKFPAAHEDAFAAYRWVLGNAASIKGDPERVAVAGERAGGNLAANVAIMARDRGVKPPVYQVLICPVAGDADAWSLGHYLNHAAESSDPRIALVRGDLGGLPPATVITAEIDPLRSEGQMLSERLGASGVPVEYRSFPGVTHEFFGTGAVVSEAKQAVAFATDGLKEAFEGPLTK
jgi:acetyl esterase/lipase